MLVQHGMVSLRHRALFAGISAHWLTESVPYLFAQSNASKIAPATGSSSSVSRRSGGIPPVPTLTRGRAVPLASHHFTGSSGAGVNHVGTMCLE
jgi:hypothetical protein